MSEITDKALYKLKNHKASARVMRSSDFYIPTVQFLEKRVEEDESFAEDVVNDKRNMDDCCEYIFKMARNKLPVSATEGWIKNETIYEWAEDYFRNTDDAVNKVLKHAVATSKTQKAGAKPKPKDEKTFDKDKAIKEAVKESPEPKETEKPKPEKKPAKKSKKGEMDGQMSLFDFI